MKLHIQHTDDLPNSVFLCAELARVLPFGEAEAERIASYQHTESARLSLAALLALEALVRDRTEEDLTIARSASGKPFFVSSPQLHFNLSHSGTLAVAALSEDLEGPVGVDLEEITNRRDCAKMADRFFTPDEQAAFRAAHGTPDCFYRLWTKKEASAKQSGTGIAAILGESSKPVSYFRYVSLYTADKNFLLTVCAEAPIQRIDITDLKKEDRWMEYRIEHDSMGEVRVPADRLWGAQTQRSLENFPIGGGRETMPPEIIHAFGILKLAAARANRTLCPNRMTDAKLHAIERAANEILSGELSEEFPLVIWQTGSGTQTNMNVNEVLAARGNAFIKGTRLHPNDDINMSQSSNDTFPTAMHVAAALILEDKVIPSAEELIQTLRRLEKENSHVIKSGRTHLQDATPIRFSQEISGWRASLERDVSMIRTALDPLQALALGGTAVGTGLNAPQGFDTLVAEEIANLTGKPFRTAENKFHALTSKDELVFAHGALKALAADLMKIANDVRWLASGPRNGLGEIFIPENEPGSSIMPGKVNPTQCEAVTMVAVQVMANDVAVGLAASQGNFELNVYMPVLMDNFLRSSRLLADVMQSFRIRCVEGIRANQEKMDEGLRRSLMTVTALNPTIGYENAAKVAKLAYQENLPLREACIRLGFLDGEQFDAIVSPEQMV